MKINMSVLGSSSRGNSTLFWDEKKSFLIDCGFSVKYIKECLFDRYLDLSKLNGVMLTHTHGDHYNDTVIKYLVNQKIKFYMHDDLNKALLKRSYAYKVARDRELIKIVDETPFRIGEFEINMFPVPHDSWGGCFGYNVIKTDGINQCKISFATDVAYTTETMVERFKDSDTIVLESNHDLDMLNSSGRPKMLIDRIRKTGHISNEECGEFLVEVLRLSTKLPKKIMLAHISQDCNTNELAVSTIKSYLKKAGFEKVSVEETFRDRPTNFISINHEQQIELPSVEE